MSGNLFAKGLKVVPEYPKGKSFSEYEEWALSLKDEDMDYLIEKDGDYQRINVKEYHELQRNITS